MVALNLPHAAGAYDARPMPDLQSRTEAAVRHAAAASVGEPGRVADPLVTPAAKPEFGDFQANLAMGLAKHLGRKPRDLALEIVASLDADDLIATADVAGPGFINLKLRDDALRQAAADALADDRVGIERIAHPRHVVIDYSGPNVAKEMHVGHLRSTVIGDALARLLAAVGHHVTRRNHLGDWGTQFGMLIEFLEERGQKQEAEGGDDARELSDLNAIYKRANARFKSESDFADRARRRVVALQSGDDATLAVWRELVATSKRHFEQNYTRLGVLLTDADVRGESSYNAMLPGVIERLDAAGLLGESDGARVVWPEGFTNRDNEPLPLIVQKSGGGFLYATTDLAAALQRIEESDADWLIYVTDSRQSQHFAMVFWTLRALELDDDVRLDHVPFGMVLGADRKPLKTREGEPQRLAVLLEEAVQRAAAVVREKSPELGADERDAVARAVGVGAVKYADLSTERTKDYVFDLDRMLAFEGNTAPYLQNAYVRTRSIFRKGGVDPADARAWLPAVDEPAERALVLHLLGMPGVAARAADRLEPHGLCNFLYEAASRFHAFYEACPVLTAPDEATRRGRLALCQLTGRTLRAGLELLGIDVPEKM